MQFIRILVSVSFFLCSAFASRAETTLNIAIVNNGDMIRMQRMTGDFTAKHPDIKLNWITLQENTLRQKVTTDIATRAGQFDIIMIGPYEVPIWAKKGWLISLDKLGADYDLDDLLPAIRSDFTVDAKLFAAPFYGESSMTMYRTGLFEKAGLTMPDAPTWDFIAAAARRINDRTTGTYGICLRGLAGWGENMALLTAMADSFGARWFDEKWKPQFNQPEWKTTLSYYVSLMKDAGPPGASANGFNENLSLFNTGKCGIWVDATVAASFITNPKESSVANDVGFALAPDAGLGKRANWNWSWAFAVPVSTRNIGAAQKFIAWATDKHYLQLVAARDGWANVPPGTRKSLYENPQYRAAAPFWKVTLSSIDAADPLHPTVKPVPYVGVQFVAIPEFQAIGTVVGQQFSAALAGNMSVDQALAAAQSATLREMTKAGYYNR